MFLLIHKTFFKKEVIILKRALCAIFAGLLVFLVSCDINSYSATAYYFGDYRVYYQSHGGCEMLVQEIILEEGENTYVLESSGCDITSYYFILFNGKYIDIPTAIEDNIITIQQVIDSEIPALRITSPTTDLTN